MAFAKVPPPENRANRFRKSKVPNTRIAKVGNCQADFSTGAYQQVGGQHEVGSQVWTLNRSRSVLMSIPFLHQSGNLPAGCDFNVKSN